MKAIAALCLCLSLNASELKLTYDGATIAANVSSAVEVYGTQDFSRWRLESRFTNSSPLRSTNRFFKARLVPPPASLSVVAVATNTLVFLSGTATVPLSEIVALASSQSVTGFMTRQFIGRGCNWTVPAFNWEGGLIALACVDINGNLVSTNVIPDQYFSAPITIDYPSGEVIGSSVRVTGFCENDNALVFIDTGTALYPCSIRRGSFVSPAIPIQQNNSWFVHYLLDEEMVIPIAFTKSPISVNYSVDNYTFLYGERGIVLRGTISDPAYDLWIGTNFISTTNGQWQIRITPQGGMIRFRVQPKASAVPFPGASGYEPLNVGDLVYAASLIGSTSYKVPELKLTKAVMTEYRGYDQTNRITFRKTEGRMDCMISYLGYGEWLDWNDEDGSCGGLPYRTLFPQKYVSNYYESTGQDAYGDSTGSTCMLYIGGEPGETFRAVIGLVLWPGYRMGNQLGFSDPVSPEGWKVGGHCIPWELNVCAGQILDVTPSIPVMESGMFSYDITLRKELIP